MLLGYGVLFAGLREADVRQDQGARDCDINGKTFTFGPDRDRHVAWAATRGRTKDILLFHNGSEHAVRGDVVDQVADGVVADDEVPTLRSKWHDRQIR